MSEPVRPGRRQRLSVLVVATPEGRRLAPTLESVRDWADEILVLDLSPQAAWRATARRYGVRWQEGGEMAAPEAQGRAFYQTDGEWVLLLEADERLDYSHGGILTRLIAEAPPAVAAFRLGVVGELAGLLPATRHEAPRLVRKRPGLAFTGPLLGGMAHRGRRLAAEAQPSRGLIFRPASLGRPERLADTTGETFGADPGADAWSRLEAADEAVRRGDADRARSLLAPLEREGGAVAAMAGVNRAAIDWQERRVTEALERLDQLIAAHPDSESGRRMKARVLGAEGRHADAIPVLESLAVLAPPTDDRAVSGLTAALLARCAAGCGDLHRAWELSEYAVAVAPRCYEVHALRAEILEESGQPVEAAQAWLRASALRPDLGAPRRRVADLLVVQGRPDDSQAFRHEADRLDALLSLSSSWMEVAEESDEPEPAPTEDSSVARAAAPEPAGPDVAATAVSAPAGPSAESPAEAPAVAPAELPTEAPATGMAGPVAEAAEPAPAEAAEPAMSADRAGTADGEAAAPPRHTLMVVPVRDPDHESVGRDDVSSGPSLPGIRVLSDPPEQLALDQRRREDVAHLEEEVAAHPDNHQAHFDLGLAWFSLREFEKAERAFRQAVRQTGKPLPREKLAVAWCRLAECSLDRGDQVQATREARSALALDGRSAEARFVLGRIAYRQGRFHEAAQEFRRILNPDREGVRVDRGLVLRELGICLYRDERHAEAAATFAEAVGLIGGDAMLRLFHGNALTRSGRMEEAVEAFREALRLDPLLSEARNNLAVLALELGNRLFDDRRYDAVLALLEGVPATPEILFLSAITRFAMGRHAAARADLELLNAQDDNFAEAHWNLALVCRELGDRPAAVAALARFRHLAPADPRGRVLEEALMKGTGEPSRG